MAVKLIANYAKRLGLPGFSSHQFSVSVETEVHDVADIAGESARLYETLQQSVDAQIQATGFVPPHGYGMTGGDHYNEDHSNGHNSADGNGATRNGTNGHRANAERRNGAHTISQKQLDLINKIVRENGVDKGEIEALAVDMFGAGVRALNRMQASNLIDELFDRYGRRQGQPGNGRREGVGV